MSSVAPSNEVRFDALRREWQATTPEKDRETEFARLMDEWRAVEWQSGGQTLLAAMGLQFQEVALCRGLAWLLDPDGGHRLGRHLLEALLRRLDLSVIDGAPVEIHVEEKRADTRADIVLRIGHQTVVLEAKVFAGEQPRQADRLQEYWANEQPTLVFLTRTGHAPYTAISSADQWAAVTWRDIAQLARAVTASADLHPSPGAREFIETIGSL